MTSYIKKGTQSGMRKMTNLNKSNQMPNHGIKIIDVEITKLISAGSKLALHY